MFRTVFYVLGCVASLAVIGASGFAVYRLEGLNIRHVQGFVEGRLDDRAYATFATHEVRREIDFHAFEDWNILHSTSPVPLGYASVDAKPTLRNSTPADHLIGLQSRPRFEGSDILDRMYAVDALVVQGSGSAINEAHGIHVYSAQKTGSGSIKENVGLFVEYQWVGDENWGIVSMNDRNYFAGLQSDRLELDGQLSLARKRHADALQMNVPEGSVLFLTDICTPADTPPACSGAPAYFAAGKWRAMGGGSPVVR